MKPQPFLTACMFPILLAVGCGSVTPATDGSGGAGSGAGTTGTAGTTGAAGTTGTAGTTGAAGKTGTDGGADRPGGDAGTGVCVTDNDCIFRNSAGCCGLCLAKSDAVPPALPCGAACRVVPPSCVCENHRCTIGTLAPGALCQPTHNLCGYELCCPQCGGVPLPDGGVSCSAPVCTQPIGASLTCPPGA